MDKDLTWIMAIDISKVYGASVYDEALLPEIEVKSFEEKYSDTTKYKTVIIE